MKFKHFSLLLLSITLIYACIQAPNQYTELPPGSWRGILKISEIPGADQAAILGEDQKIIDYFELPFNFEVKYLEGNKMIIELMNGDEKILLDDINYGRDPATAKDTLQIQFSDFDSSLDAFYEENFIEGFWVVPNKGENYKIPFLAQYGNTHRFNIKKDKPEVDLTGNWKTVFNFNKDNPYNAIAELQQEGNRLEGTFMTETGDYRYLEGNVDGDKMMLSVFDGAHAFLFTAKMIGDTLVGEFRSGSHYLTNWIATRNDSFQLADPYDMTQATSESGIDFEFETLDGQMLGLSDEKFDSRIKLINIMGTWCPNCKDEIMFLKEFKENNSDIAIISIAFEKYKDKEKAFEVIRRYRDKLEIDWDVLYGGYANKKAISEQLEFLDKIYSYPTLLILDENNVVRGIQTGFYGPATSKHEEFKKEFYRILEGIQSEDV